MSSVSRRNLCLGLAVAASLPSTVLYAQPRVRPFCGFSLRAGWKGSGPAEYITHRAGPGDPSGIPQVVTRIKSSLSINSAIDILIAEDEDNAFATVAGGRKIIVIDVGFLENLNQVTGTEWSAISVIAHEIGHHIAGFIQDSHRGELNADYWSGQCLQRLGSSREAATACILRYGTDYDTDSHPNKRTRAATIDRGWNDASQDHIDYSFCTECE